MTKELRCLCDSTSSDMTLSPYFELGWSDLTNGELLASAEASFDLLLTTDQKLRYQQNLAGRNLAIVVLMTTSWPRIRAQVARVVETVSGTQPGEYIEVSLP